MRIVLLVVSLILCAGFISRSPAAQTPGFDIQKVREAVAEGNQRLAGDTALAGAAAQGAPNESAWLIILRIVAYLALVLAILFGGVWVFKRLSGKSGTRAGSGSMDVVEMLPIGQGRSIVLVRILDAVMVLAQTSQTVTLIEKIEGEKALELIAATREGASIVQFKELFNNFIGRMKK